MVCRTVVVSMRFLTLRPCPPAGAEICCIAGSTPALSRINRPSAVSFAVDKEYIQCQIN